MHFLNTLLVRLLRLSFKVRLTLVILCCIVGFIPYLYSQFSGPLLAISLALAAWLFKQRGALICNGCILLGIATVLVVQNHGFIWSTPQLIGFVAGGIALFTEGFFICYLRYLLDLSEEARMQMKYAEIQKQIAYEKEIEAVLSENRLNMAYEQQRYVNQLKDRFLLNVSHELRTPLQIVLGCLELLQTFDEPLDTSVRFQSLDHALRACQELRSLVNNILDTVQIDSGEYVPKLEECQVAQVVRRSIRLLEPEHLQAARFHIDIQEDIVVVADPQHLCQILLNLLTNAIKYTPGEASVSIDAKYMENTEQEDQINAQACISVKDTGLGIPPEEIPFLFERFGRFQRDVAGPVRGIGLGLFICKELVQAMGGKIWGESTGVKGEGCCFSFTLPAVLQSGDAGSNGEK